MKREESYRWPYIVLSRSDALLKSIEAGQVMELLILIDLALS